MHFIVPGKPQPLHRHRTTKQGRVYDDPRNGPNKDAIVIAARLAGVKIIDGPVSMILYFRIPRPKSHYRTGKYSHILKDSAPSFVLTKPDIDNYAKLVLDAMNGIAYNDDCQVVDLEVRKLYADNGDEHTYIELWPSDEALILGIEESS